MRMTWGEVMEFNAWQLITKQRSPLVFFTIRLGRPTICLLDEALMDLLIHYLVHFLMGKQCEYL